MKRLIAFGICWLSLAFTYAQPSLNVMTFNIRYDNPKDAPNAWPDRKDKVCSQILFQEAALIGVQEALHHQVQDMRNGLPEYQYTGVGRDDGKEKGEYSCIFYHTQRLRLLASSTFWLSETPDVPGSKSWDAAITRVVTWAKFRDLKTKKVFFAFNTHFDHMGTEARRQSARLLLRAIDSIAGKIPSVITGDFNAKPEDEPIRIITEKTNTLALYDTRALSITPHYGPNGTFNAFGRSETDNAPIDYIFVKGNWKVWQHGTLSQTWQGLFSSDHFPVFSRLTLH